MLAQNRSQMKSACAGVFLAGMAGDMAAGRMGVSLVATDVIKSVPEAIRQCLNMGDGL